MSLYKKSQVLKPGYIGGGENRTVMARSRFSIDKSNGTLRQFTQILRTRRDETDLKLFLFWLLHNPFTSFIAFGFF